MMEFYIPLRWRGEGSVFSDCTADGKKTALKTGLYWGVMFWWALLYVLGGLGQR